MSDFTPIINENNIDAVRLGIFRKNNPKPYIATVRDGRSTFTDMDTFPYPRFYRGVPTSSEPVVFEREAGFRIRDDPCYRVTKCSDKPGPNDYPKHCFEAACSTVYPCFHRDSILTIRQGCIPYTP